MSGEIRCLSILKLLRLKGKSSTAVTDNRLRRQLIRVDERLLGQISESFTIGLKDKTALIEVSDVIRIITHV